MTAPLPVGATAPDFALRDQHGATVRLGDLRGGSAGPVVVVFFPFAFSGVCTGELQDLRDRWPALAPGVPLVALSCDPMQALRAYADAERIDFPLLSDFWPHGAVADAFGVLDPDKGCPRRSTFVVSRDGRVVWSVHQQWGAPRDPEEYAAAARAHVAR